MKPRRLAAALLLLAFVSACASAEKDAESVCAVMTELESEEDPAVRATTAAQRIEGLNLTSDTRRALEAVQYAEPSVRYEMLQMAFREQGADFECPAAERAWAAQPETP